MRVARVIDCETTGMEPPREVIEIGWQDVIVDEGDVTMGQFGWKLFGARDGIPPETMAVHHITPAMVEGLAPCESPNGYRVGGLPPHVLVAHNAEFEGRWWTEEVRSLPDGGEIPLLCTLKAALRVWPEAPGHSNSVLRYWLGLDLEEDRAMPPHRAGPDAYVTAHILKALLDHATIEQMIAWTKEPRLLPTCPIGAEWRGKPWSAVDAGFLRWMLNNATMEADLKWNAQRELDRRASRYAMAPA